VRPQLEQNRRSSRSLVAAVVVSSASFIYPPLPCCLLLPSIPGVLPLRPYHEHIEHRDRRGQFSRDKRTGRPCGGRLIGFPQLFRVHSPRPLNRPTSMLSGFTPSRVSVADRRQFVVVQGVEAAHRFLAARRHVDPVQGRLRHAKRPSSTRREVAEEQGEQQGVDVRAVDVGVGHQDHLAIAEAGKVGMIVDPWCSTPRATAMSCTSLLRRAFRLHFPGVQHLAAQGQDGLGLRSRACLAEPPAESPSTRNSSLLSGSLPLASDNFPGSTTTEDWLALFHLLRRLQPARRRLAARSASALPCSTLPLSQDLEGSRTMAETSFTRLA